MRAGLLRHRVEIMEPSDERDAYGETNAFKLWGVIWASVRQVGGGESGGPSTRDSTADMVEVDCRYNSEITTKMVVIWREREYDIESIRDEEGRGRSLRLLAVARPD